MPLFPYAVSMPKNFSAQQLVGVANQIRINTLKMLEAAGSGHTGGPLGIADVLAALYFSVMNVDPVHPRDPYRDRFVLSAAHMVPVLYATLIERGFISQSELLTLRKNDSRLKGHTFRDLDIGVETTGGSLGQGIGIAVGMALAGKLHATMGRPTKKKSKPDELVDYRVYCVIGDGESNEGSVWEAAMLAAKYSLDNLCVVCDRNHIQLSETSDVIMPLDPVVDKWKAFNWNVIEVDGNDIPQVLFAFSKAKMVSGKPSIIIANTVPGKGVSFMENKWEWHGKVPDKKQLDIALAELTANQS